MSVGFDTENALADTIDKLAADLRRVPVSALFAAGKAFRLYRRAGGIRTGVLPDFFIGAHAQVAGFAILTRDRAATALTFPPSS